MEIMGRGFKQIIQESPLYFHLGLKYAGYKILNKRSPFYGSADITNICNLHCTHCYWWLNRKEEESLTLEQWEKIIDEKFKKHHIFIVTLVGGEPLMKPDIVELFVKKFPKRACVVTNGTYQLPHFENLYFYWISIDGTREIHNKIRGDGSWEKTRKNVIEYVNTYGNKAWKDIWITMTINSENFKSIKKVISDWKDFSNKIGFQFHTPFMKNDPLWIPFGDIRDKVVDEIIEMKENEYKDYIVNPKKQLEIMKRSWGGRGSTPINCPTWTILSLDHMGQEKLPCCIGSSEKNSLKPRCEDCGIGCYSVSLAYGMKG